MITLTKKEQELGLEMLMSKTNKKDQKVFISQAFFRTICKLKKYGLLEAIKKGRNCDYELTNDGRILFSILANFKGNEEFKDFAIKGTKIILFA